MKLRLPCKRSWTRRSERQLLPTARYRTIDSLYRKHRMLDQAKTRHRRRLLGPRLLHQPKLRASRMTWARPCRNVWRNSICLPVKLRKVLVQRCRLVHLSDLNRQRLHRSTRPCSHPSSAFNNPRPTCCERKTTRPRARLSVRFLLSMPLKSITPPFNDSLTRLRNSSIQ